MRALDLFCKAGGVSEGLRRAGFDVVGVDIEAQPHHRGGVFVQADAILVLEDLLRAYRGAAAPLAEELGHFDLIWASPPCQAYSALRHLHPDRRYPDLIPRVRGLLQHRDVEALWVIENVEGAPLRNGFTLCGAAFGLGCYGEDGVWRSLRRHRLFESSWPVLAPPCRCDGSQVVGVYGGGSTRPGRNSRSGWSATASQAREALGIDWMNRNELAQAIPPAYAEWIGRQASAHLAQRRAA